MHALWKHFLELDTEVHVVRVPTDDNIADNPSRYALGRRASRYLRPGLRSAHRESYEIFRAIGDFKRVRAKLDKVYLQAQTWEALSLRATV